MKQARRRQIRRSDRGDPSLGWHGQVFLPVLAARFRLSLPDYDLFPRQHETVGQVTGIIRVRNAGFIA